MKKCLCPIVVIFGKPLLLGYSLPLLAQQLTERFRVEPTGTVRPLDHLDSGKFKYPTTTTFAVSLFLNCFEVSQSVGTRNEAGTEIDGCILAEEAATCSHMSALKLVST